MAHGTKRFIGHPISESIVEGITCLYQVAVSPLLALDRFLQRVTAERQELPWVLEQERTRRELRRVARTSNDVLRAFLAETVRLEEQYRRTDWPSAEAARLGLEMLQYAQSDLRARARQAMSGAFEERT